jgi:imidazolonepropionase-like amidohydrolase
VADAGGPVFGLKRAIDEGLIPGPRIWPSDAFISQTGGHGDFRMPNEMPARPGDRFYGDRTHMAMIVDGVDAVRKRVREQLAHGASQIKLHADGGVSSSYDPLDVTRFSLEAMRAAVNAAENWGTRVIAGLCRVYRIQQQFERAGGHSP